MIRGRSEKLCLKRRMSLIQVCCSILYFLGPTPQVYSCNNLTVGNSACIRISRYSGEQWSTCVTNMYIRQKSKGRHGCTKGQAICIYQCMLEVHGADSGTVVSPCACSAGKNLKTTDKKSQTTIKPASNLPSWCFSPTGADCSWFKTCLGQRFSCGKRFEGEVIKFAEVICKLYLNPYSDLSRNGTTWVNGVRKCFQVNLVLLLRTWNGANEGNCGSLTKKALSIYSRCFYSPFPGYIPTICELPLSDLWRIFWHLRQTLSENVKHSLLEMVRIIEKCTQFRKANLNSGKVRKFVFHAKRLGDSEVSKSNEILRERNFLIEELVKQIAKQFFLSKEGIAWFAYPRKLNKFNSNTTEFVFYLADKHEHRMSRRLQYETVVNLNNTVLTLLEAVRRSELRFQVPGSAQDYQITAITVCQDLECRRNSWKAIAGSARNGSTILGSVGSFLLLAQFVLFTVFI